jgi:hypothetical protein
LTDGCKAMREGRTQEKKTEPMASLYLACCLAVVVGAEMDIRPDQPNAIGFPAEEARFVRLVISENTSSEPCIDELEVYGPEGKENLTLAKTGAKATASSMLRQPACRWPCGASRADSSRRRGARGL